MAFALSFDDRATAEEAAEELRDRGFDVTELEPVTAAIEVRDAEELADVRDDLRELAAELGGDFLGTV